MSDPRGAEADATRAEPARAEPGGADATRALYARRGLGGRLDPPARPAVVVVDLIEGFTDPACPPGSDLDAVVTATGSVLARARAAGLPVFFTTIAFPPERLDEAVWLRKMPALSVLTEGSHWTRVDPRLAPGPDEPVLTKQAASAFHGTGLAERLAATGADGVVVCGATTSGCVRATVIDACSHDFPAFVPRDCVGDRAQGPHEANLLDIDAKYADVLDAAATEELMARW